MARLSESGDVLKAALRDAAVTRAAICARGAMQGLPRLAESVVPGRALMIVADANTWRAAGARARDVLAASAPNAVEPLVLPAEPRLKPMADTARAIAGTIREKRAVPIAVGSGVISDLVKLAAEMADEPYVCVATAASMDGYAASGAAVIEQGFKLTLPCRPPIAVLADLDAIAIAPRAMSGWGYGDLAGKVVAGADWMLADAIGAEAINPRPFAMVQDSLEGWLACADAIGRADAASLGGLVEGLLITGFAMQAHGNSRPASGSDHFFAHLWEMENLAIDGVAVAHGACVGIGCLTILALYDWLLKQDPTRVDIDRRIAVRADFGAIGEEVEEAFADPAVRRSARQEAEAKYGDPVALHARLTSLHHAWPNLSARLAERLPSVELMRRRLAAAGAPATSSAIGISARRLAADCRRARLIRRRYTILDLLDDLGWLDRAIAEAVEPDTDFPAGLRVAAGGRLH